jgi:multiple sugar transport system ATP-binding protein
MARVTLSGVRKVFGTNDVAVDDATFEVRDGEFMVLVGPSGCGKSTTLRMIAGLESVSAGEVRIGERLVNEVPPSDRDIAMVFQSYALYPHMSVQENMSFALRLRKLPRNEIETRMRSAAEMLGLETVLHRLPKALSGGQRQRVAIGRAIVRQPQAFLFDEPLSNLDAKMRVQMRREISSLQRRLGVTTVYVTHDQVEAMTMGDRIVVMNKGKIQQIDTPLGLYDAPRNLFVAGFIGSPAINLLRGTISQNGDAVEFRASDGVVLPLTGEQAQRVSKLDGRAVIAGIRPESLYLEQSPRPAGPFARVTLPLVAVEPLGNEALLYARVDERELTARVAPHPLPVAGDRVELLLDLSRVHLFDAETTERL